MADGRIHRLQNELPMPLAQLLKRALRAGPGLEQHTSAFYVAEASIKLAAGMRVGRWLDTACKPGTDLAKRLESLALPSLGMWAGFLRELSADLAKTAKAAGAEADAIARGASALEKTPDAWGGVQAFAAATLREEILGDETVKRSLKRGSIGAFELFVGYRNEVVGHGAQRSARFYEEFGGLLLEALADVLSQPTLFAGLELAVPKLSIARGGRGTELQWSRLTGLGAFPADAPVGVRAVGGSLYFLGDGLCVPIHPLVVYQEDEHGQERFGFLNKALVKKGETEVKRVDYLDYATGEGLSGVDEVAALGELLTKLRGTRVGAESVAATMAALDRSLLDASASPARAGVANLSAEVGVDAASPTGPEAPTRGPTSRPESGTGAAPPDPVVVVVEAGAQPRAATETPASSGGFWSQEEAVLGQEIGNYRVIGKLGEGGMGTVYEVEHTKLARRYAMKFLRRELCTSDAMLTRFEREAREAAATRHPGIIDVIDLGRTAGGGAYLVMEKLEGASVGDLLLEGPLPIERAVWIASEALDALAAAHARGLVHRDVKPDNLFVANGPKGESVKVLDFGIAKVVESSAAVTTTSAMLGTPVYMSPDQIQNSAGVDARADVYSLGATLYEMLTGKNSVQGASVPFVLTEIIQDHIARDPREHREEVTPALADVVAKSTAYRREDRFESAAAMRKALLDSAVLAAPEFGPHTVKMVPEQPKEEPATPEPEDGKPPPSRSDTPQHPGAARPRWPWLAAGAALLAAIGVVATRGGTSGARNDVPSATATVTAALPASVAAASASSGARAEAAPEGMVLLRGTAFSMGSTLDETKAAFASCPKPNGPFAETCSSGMFDRERELHEVRIASFALDAREVTNGELAKWLSSLEGMTLREEAVPGGRRWFAFHQGARLAAVGMGYSGLQRDGERLGVSPGAEDRAAVAVTWVAAKRYCEARGKRLPTEAEWELAARGTERRVYPWGSTTPTCEGVAFGRPTDVEARSLPGAKERFACIAAEPGPSKGSMPLDRTPEGVQGLGGNVREWVLDAFDESAPQLRNCQGACVDPGRDASAGASFHVVRGGGFHDPAPLVRAARRTYHEETGVDDALGFRCARPLDGP